MDKKSKIFVAGHKGMVGAAIVIRLQEFGYSNIITRTHSELDLIDQQKVNEFFEQEKPEYVFIAAAKVGGIKANNDYRAEFIYENLMIECNIIHAAYKYGVNKLLALGSSCIYRHDLSIPLMEEDLMMGKLEPTNEPYAIAKIAGIKLCEAYRDQYGFNAISCMPPNLYGRGEDYDKPNTHVFPMLLKRFHEAKENNLREVMVWGTGKPYREFMYCDDMADSCIFLMLNYDGRQFLNTGTGEEVTIKELAYLIKNEVGYKGDIVFDTTKPDGTMRKVMNIDRIHNLGWHHKISLQEGIKLAYHYFKKDYLKQGV